MCFSAEADFTAAAVIGVVGVATLAEVRDRDEAIVASLPLLFAVHQLVEGFVWRGLGGQVSGTTQATATLAYLVYAQGILPIIVPFGFLLLESDRPRRRWLWPLCAIGLAVGLRLLWDVTQYPVSAQIHGHGLEYATHTPWGAVLGVGYLLATCGPPLLSSWRYLRWFGVANVAGVVVTLAVKSALFASVWCVYAALASVLILLHVRRRRREEALTQPA